MLYTLYEAGYYAASPLRFAALAAREFWSSPLNPAAESELGRRIYATSDLFANLMRRDRGDGAARAPGRPATNMGSVMRDCF